MSRLDELADEMFLEDWIAVSLNTCIKYYINEDDNLVYMFKYVKSYILNYEEEGIELVDEIPINKLSFEQYRETIYNYVEMLERIQVSEPALGWLIEPYMRYLRPSADLLSPTALAA